MKNGMDPDTAKRVGLIIWSLHRRSGKNLHYVIHSEINPNANYHGFSICVEGKEYVLVDQITAKNASLQDTAIVISRSDRCAVAWHCSPHGALVSLSLISAQITSSRYPQEKVIPDMLLTMRHRIAADLPKYLSKMGV